jgi:hypothetical protein
LCISISIEIMGSKFSKASGSVNVKSETEKEGSSQKPNEIRPIVSSGKSADSSNHETETLPRHFDRSRSVSKRFRRSCRNWAVGKGFIAEKKTEEVQKAEAENQTETDRTKDAKDNDLTLIDLEENPEIHSQNTKEGDIGSIVAELVLDAKKRKELSKAQSEKTINHTESTEKIDTALENECESEALETLDKPKVIHEIQVTLEEETEDVTAPRILINEKTEEVSEINEAATTSESVKEHGATDKEGTYYSDKDNLRESEKYVQETSFDEPIQEIERQEKHDNSIPNNEDSRDSYFYFDMKMNEEFLYQRGMKLMRLKKQPQKLKMRN